MEQTVAIIDLGSNSIRMVINVIYKNGKYKVIDSFREMVRLSEGMSSDNLLKELPMQRTLEALTRFRTYADAHNCRVIVAVATAALRRAHNKSTFLQKVKADTGIEFDIISGVQEGYYDYLGIKNSIGIEDGIILDMGGGSFEMVHVKEGEMVVASSVQAGAVVLTEQFRNKPQSLLYRYVSQQIGTAEWIDMANSQPVYFTGGSARAMAKCIKPNYDPNKSRSQLFNRRKITEFYYSLLCSTYEERVAMPGIGEERADIILAGVTPLKALIDMLGSENVIVCSHGLRDGVFFRLRQELLKKWNGQ